MPSPSSFIHNPSTRLAWSKPHTITLSMVMSKTIRKGSGSQTVALVQLVASLFWSWYKAVLNLFYGATLAGF